MKIDNKYAETNVITCVWLQANLIHDYRIINDDGNI
jgi:hypothetical protein